MNDLSRWRNYAFNLISNFFVKLPFEEQERLRKKQEEYIKLYQEPISDEKGVLRVEQLTPENREVLVCL